MQPTCYTLASRVFATIIRFKAPLSVLKTPIGSCAPAEEVTLCVAAYLPRGRINRGSLERFFGHFGSIKNGGESRLLNFSELCVVW